MSGRRSVALGSGRRVRRGRCCRGELEQPFRVAPEDLVPLLHRERGVRVELPVRVLDAVRPRAVRVGIVRLDHHIVDPDVAHVHYTVHVVDEAAEHMLTERLLEIEPA